MIIKDLAYSSSLQPVMALCQACKRVWIDVAPATATHYERAWLREHGRFN